MYEYLSILILYILTNTYVTCFCFTHHSICEVVCIFVVFICIFLIIIFSCAYCLCIYLEKYPFTSFEYF